MTDRRRLVIAVVAFSRHVCVVRREVDAVQRAMRLYRVRPVRIGFTETALAPTTGGAGTLVSLHAALRTGR